MKKPLLISALALVVSSAFASGGAVYTLSNQVAGNQILSFDRTDDGKLTPGPAINTGGLGTGSGLGNQNAIVLSNDNRFLFAVNAGSNNVSVFKFRGNTPELIDLEPALGVRPISITQHGKWVYVLNAGDATHAAGIQGFWLNNSGDLEPLAGASGALSTAQPGPAQIQFNTAGDSVVVTEKGTNLVDVFSLDKHGYPTSASYNPANGITPFGFDFDNKGRLFVAEAFGGGANASALSSYKFGVGNDLQVVTGSAPTTETAACWAVVTKDGKFVYTTNAGSGTVSGYRIANEGSVSLLNGDGVTASTGAGSAPIDIANSLNGRFIYVLGGGAHSIFTYRVLSNGQLEAIDVDGGLPVGTNGLAAR